MDSFAFAMGCLVGIEFQDKRQGRVVGQLLYLSGARSYLVRYQDAEGDAVERWWDESALIATP